MIGLVVTALVCGLFARLRFKSGALGTCLWALVGTFTQQLTAWGAFKLVPLPMRNGTSMHIVSVFILIGSVLVSLFAVILLIRLFPNRDATPTTIAAPSVARKRRRDR